MNKTTAENFINSLVRNLQALCHSNVEFFDDIEVVGHLYLKVDKSKKFNYIVDEKVSKNDASSTVFVSNSYHSCKQNRSKASESDIDRVKDIQNDMCATPGKKNVNRNSLSDGEQSKIPVGRLDNSEPPYKSQKISHLDKTEDDGKRKKINYRNLTEKMHSYKNIESDNSIFEIDLTKIKCEPKDENVPNAEFFLGSPPQTIIHSSGNMSGSNAIDTGQANEEYTDYLQNESSLSLHQSHLDKPSTSRHSPASSNFLSQDMSQGSISAMVKPVEFNMNQKDVTEQLSILFGPLRQRSTYSKEEKRKAVQLAKIEGIQKAAEQLNIPASTIYMWRKSFQNK